MTREKGWHHPTVSWLSKPVTRMAPDVSCTPFRRACACRHRHRCRRPTSESTVSIGHVADEQCQKGALLHTCRRTDSFRSIGPPAPTTLQNTARPLAHDLAYRM
eukprot:4447586-Prymnesium_polylepis.1